MTIRYRLLIGQSLTDNQRQVIQAIVEQTFDEVNRYYNKWNADSELSQLNRLPANEKRQLSPQLYQFLLKVGEIVKWTEGRFDPTVEPIQQLWKQYLEQGQTPTQEEILALRPCIGWDKIHLNDGFFFKDDSRTSLDLGGIAKGYCVDLIVERLNQAGFANVFMEWGGEIRASGEHPSHRPWNIYISRFEDARPNHALAYVSLKDQAIATSGDYFQFWTAKTTSGEQKIYTHIFNPLTLQPLEVKPGSIASASLLADSCILADGLAKVAMLFDSLEEAQQWTMQVQKMIPNLTFWMVTREEVKHPIADD